MRRWHRAQGLDFSPSDARGAARAEAEAIEHDERILRAIDGADYRWSADATAARAILSNGLLPSWNTPSIDFHSSVESDWAEAFEALQRDADQELPT
jgi:hypothetical protein